MSKWIPVIDQLPPAEVVVWCYDTQMGVILGRYYPIMKSWAEAGNDWLHGVTHWQPCEIPGPPEIDKL